MISLARRACDSNYRELTRLHRHSRWDMPASMARKEAQVLVVMETQVSDDPRLVRCIDASGIALI
jgi:hypothetical protein